MNIMYVKVIPNEKCAKKGKLKLKVKKKHTSNVLHLFLDTVHYAPEKVKIFNNIVMMILITSSELQ